MPDKYFDEAVSAMHNLDLSRSSRITTKDWWLSLNQEQIAEMEGFSICPSKSFLNKIVFDIGGVDNSETTHSNSFYENIGLEADWYLNNMVKVDISETYPKMYKCIDKLRVSKNTDILLIDTLIFLSLTGSLSCLLTAINKPNFIAWLKTT
jgi:hypothetical protein